MTRKSEVRSLKFEVGKGPRVFHFLLQTSDFILPFGPIAQRLEPPAHNRPVPGSNPGGPTNLRSHVTRRLPAVAASRRRRASEYPGELRLASLPGASPREGVRRSLGEGGPSIAAQRRRRVGAPRELRLASPLSSRGIACELRPGKPRTRAEAVSPKLGAVSRPSGGGHTTAVRFRLRFGGAFFLGSTHSCMPTSND